MSNCVKCGAALPWAGKSCAFCGTPVAVTPAEGSDQAQTNSEPIPSSAVPEISLTVPAASTPPRLESSTQSDEDFTEDELVAYRARAQRRSIWGFISLALGLLMLLLPIPFGEERALRPAGLVSWEGITAMVESFSAANDQYSTIGQSGNWTAFAVGTLLANSIYLLTGLLLIVMGILGVVRAMRLPRWAYLTASLGYVGTLTFSFVAYYRLMDFIYSQLQGLPTPAITDLFAIVFGVTDVGQNWGSLSTNLLLPLAVLVVGVFGGMKDHVSEPASDFDEYVEGDYEDTPIDDQAVLEDESGDSAEEVDLEKK